MNTHTLREFPGGPVVGTLCFHSQGCGFNPWSGNYNPASCAAWPINNYINCSCDGFPEEVFESLRVKNPGI